MHRCWRRCWPVTPGGSTNSPAPSPPPPRRAWRPWPPGSHRASTGSWVSTSSCPTPTGCSTTFGGVTIRRHPMAARPNMVRAIAAGRRRCRAVLPAAFIGSGLTRRIPRANSWETTTITPAVSKSVPMRCCLRRSPVAASPRRHTGAPNSSPRKATTTTHYSWSISCERRPDWSTPIPPCSTPRHTCSASAPLSGTPPGPTWMRC